MGFVRLSDELSERKRITLENIFVFEYMPFAPEGFVKVYLMGLAMSAYEDNEPDSMALSLGLDKQALIEAFTYWQTQGLVNFSPEQLSVEYLPVMPYSRVPKLYSPTKYKAFNDQLHTLIKERPINKNEYDQYYNLMESYHIEDHALLTIIGYCIRLQGPSVKYQYILTVAKNLAEQDLTTYDKVSEKLSEMDLNDADLRAVLKTLSLKRSADHYDRNLLLKWKKEFGFSLETIIQVAKRVKRGGIQTLDMLLARYYENHLFDIDKIDAFEENRKQLYDLTRHITNILGIKYDQLDYIIENYVAGWIAMGYEHETMLDIAKLCQKTNVRTLERMNETVAKFFKMGIVTHDSLNNFIYKLNKSDDEIKKLLKIMGVSDWVDERERNFYRTWTQSWKLPYELLILGAEKASGKQNPISYMNTVLASWHEKNIKTVEEAKKTDEPKQQASSPAPSVNPDNFVKRTLSAEELNAMLESLEEL